MQFKWQKSIIVDWLYLIKTPMMRNLLCLVFFSTYCIIAMGQQKYWQQQVNYTINVSLNDADNTLDGAVSMNYFNNSPDTLHFIWMHLWPNAYKNDLTALSDQTLQNGSTDFYFSNNDQRGYINRLNFTVNGSVVQMENHPQHQDIIKIILSAPLAPGANFIIQTPFHEKLPFNFSRGGHNGQSYQATQWYPKPAVYDSKGWHPMPYLNQGEFYSEFGNYTVQITLPANYVVAATGNWVDEKITPIIGKTVAIKSAPKKAVKKDIFHPQKTVEAEDEIPSARNLKTVTYTQQNVHDFAWFADKRFKVVTDTLALASGRVIKVNAFNVTGDKDKGYWKNAVNYIKKAVLTRSERLGEYPYDVVTAAEGNVTYPGGMEYPTITLISGVTSQLDLEELIEHEVGHNWFYGILASNEREHAWMDEGMNTYYDTRYWNGEKDINVRKESDNSFIANRLPSNLNIFIMQYIISLQKDQPIETASEKLAGYNYDPSVYHKASRWMKLLEQTLGRSVFDSCMHSYYKTWKFKHPYPEDFKAVVEKVSNKNVDAIFSLLSKKGNLSNTEEKRELKLASFFSLKDTDKYKYIFVTPAIGNNLYDKLMLGVAVHNYTLPAEKFQFLVAPFYATGSKKINSLARVSYTWMPGTDGKQVIFSLAGSKFSRDEFIDSIGTKTALGFSKIVPSVKIIFANSNPLSHVKKFLQWKTFFISEQNYLFTRDTVNQADNITYPTVSRYLNQLKLVAENNRVLYPYKGELMAEQGRNFARLAFTGNYFFNYAKGGGMEVRLFAGKFFYLGEKTYITQYETDPYQLNLTGPRGYEDYTYANYFAGRNKFDGIASQQIMQRDGFFKVGTDLLGSKIGKTDNWLVAANFTSSIPKLINPLEVLPFKIPLKFFVDIGTYAEAWSENTNKSKFLYDAGLQLSLFKDVLNVYVPIFYSKVYSDYYKSTITEKRFLKTISFSVDIQNFRLKKLLPQLAF